MDIDITPIDDKNVDIPYFLKFAGEELKKHISLVKSRDYKKNAFATSNKNNFKRFFEEIIPLMFFLEREKGIYGKIKYMSGHQKGDAILDDSITIEITKTQPYVHTNKEHVDDVALYIHNAIEKKRKKDYPYSSILIISFESDTLMLECDGDYSCLEKEIMNFEKGIFSKIYIIENFLNGDLQPKWQFIL